MTQIERAEALAKALTDLRHALREVQEHHAILDFALNGALLDALAWEVSGAEDRLHDDIRSGFYPDAEE